MGRVPSKVLWVVAIVASGVALTELAVEIAHYVTGKGGFPYIPYVIFVISSVLAAQTWRVISNRRFAARSKNRD